MTRITFKKKFAQNKLPLIVDRIYTNFLIEVLIQWLDTTRLEAVIQWLVASRLDNTYLFSTLQKCFSVLFEPEDRRRAYIGGIKPFIAFTLFAFYCLDIYWARGIYWFYFSLYEHLQ